MKTVIVAYGTRPEYIKLTPIIAELKRHNIPVFVWRVAQHIDLVESLFAELVPSNHVTRIDTNNSNRLSGIVSQILNDDFKTPEDSIMLVQGDTATAYGCAMWAFHNNIPLLHVEAGLRTGDLQQPYPEEGYRRMISSIASMNFAPTEESAENLQKEEVPGAIHVTGNTVLDHLLQYKGLERGSFDDVLITIHRRENKANFVKYTDKLNELAKEYSEQLTLTFVLHPNSGYTKSAAQRKWKNLMIVPPISYEDMPTRIAQSAFIVTDSGGLQEEGAFFDKQVLVLRNKTERPEGIETGHIKMCGDLVDLEYEFKQALENKDDPEALDMLPCPYGDGKAAEKIVRLIRKHYILK